MSCKKILLIMLLLCLAVVGVGTAQNMSISDLGYVGAQTIEIYTVDGELDGTYNTTSTGIVLPDDDFYVIVKPTTANMDVSVMLGNAMAWIVQYWVAIVFAFGAILILVRKW